MAMYYQNSSGVQGDGLQTLYLMNPNNYAPYSDTQHNMQFLNSAAALMPPPVPPQPQPQPHLVGIPLSSHDPSLAQNTMRHHYTTWGGSLDHNQPNTTPRGRGLSLSLSAHHPAISGDRDFPAGQGVISPTNSVIMGSKYLKIAQELLDEVVNVGSHRHHKAKPIKDSSTTEAQTANEAAAAADLSTAQRQDIQMKKAKLSSMLEEVEQRCRQYHQQMQMIIAAFEQAAGTGSARSYTQLALKTILKQFRCLKSTICAEIKALNKSLGEEGCPENNLQGSRLRFVDQEVRQQLGMMHNNAWRPQRGLPERAVSVLRAWLFQHFLHPYPKDSDKQMLAKQTGLTRSQVSNWFINARVRLWKPMVEEMYLEETKNQQQNQNASSIKSEPEPEPETKNPPTAPETSHPSQPGPGPGPSLPSRTNFAQLISSLNMENNLSEKNPKKPRNDVEHVNERFSTENYLPMGAANMNRYEMGMGELHQQLAAGFAHGNSSTFSLSLALPPTQTSFLSHRSFEIESEGGRINEGGYDMLDFQNRKQPFPPQLMPDFVT